MVGFWFGLLGLMCLCGLIDLCRIVALGFGVFVL